MSQSNREIEDVFESALDEHCTSVTFESVWNKYDMKNKYIFGFKKAIALPVIVLITFIAVFTAGFATYNIMRNIDKTDYPFVDDRRVIGKWESVDFVSEIDDFTPENKNWKEGLFLNSLVFINGGSMLSAIENDNLAQTTFTWTKDIILNKREQTASKYEIKEFNGNSYMFFEWKSGDYVFRNMSPHYYVLKKVDSRDYSSYQVKQIVEDKIDYPFVDDSQVKGEWKSVDFVENIDNFKPREKSFLGDLFFTGLNFEEGGTLTIKASGRAFSNPFIWWTKGLVLSKQEKTASRYEIRELEGQKYLFFEWKSGDYIYRNMKPQYYVMKKVQ